MDYSPLIPDLFVRAEVFLVNHELKLSGTCQLVKLF